MNRYAHLNEPQDVLDFHGRGSITGAEVKRETIAFIKASTKHGYVRVRIVSGKGRHSSGKPLVKPQVERTLRALSAEGSVRRWQPETLDGGGDGAFRVDL
jgi:DNA-nicking Smr family endonuclease